MIDLVVKASAGVLIVIVLALGIHYADAAFENNSAVADASIVINESQQIKNAWNSFSSDNGQMMPTSFADLLNGKDSSSGNYLNSVPIVPTAEGGVAAFPIFIAAAPATGMVGMHYFAYADLGRPSSHRDATDVDNSNAAACVRLQRVASPSHDNPDKLVAAGQGSIFALGGNNVYGCGILSNTISGGFGGAPVPDGDLQTGDYVMEYLIQ